MRSPSSFQAKAMARLTIKTKNPCPRWSHKNLDWHFGIHGEEVAASIPYDSRFFSRDHYRRESCTTFGRRVIGFDAESWEAGRCKHGQARYSIDGRALLTVTEIDDSGFRTFFPVGKDGPVQASELVSMTSQARHDYVLEWTLKRIRSKKFTKLTNCDGITC
jgi:hypothetical protein